MLSAATWHTILSLRTLEPRSLSRVISLPVGLDSEGEGYCIQAIITTFDP
mgnify:CR=1 FL=1